MTWYIVGMIITYFAATTEELSVHGPIETFFLLLLWPVILGATINDIRTELKHARELRTTRHENRA